MGNCFPVPKNIEPDMNLKSSPMPKDSTYQIGSSVRDTNVNVDSYSMKLQSHSQELGNKEEIFFDSQPWIDSDIEDFLSVNGDSSPVDGSSFRENPDSDDKLIAETSPTEMKKQLFELFRESFGNDVDQNQNSQEKPQLFLLPSSCKNTDACDYGSVNNSISIEEPAPNVQPNRAKSKPGQFTNCCLPSLMRSLSSSSDRKKKMSTAL